jgi:molybdopterin synthase catalytic subunit
MVVSRFGIGKVRINSDKQTIKSMNYTKYSDLNPKKLNPYKKWKDFTER